MTIEFEQWFERFKPKKNKVTTDSPYMGYLYDTHGKDMDYLRNSSEDNYHVWTIVDCDNEEQYILPGWHIVNRAGHFITEKAWSAEEAELQVNLNEMITVGAAKYAAIEFLEMIGVPEEKYEDLIHDWFSQKF